MTYLPPAVPIPVQIGEGFEGSGVSIAHVNTVLGDRNGAIGGAWSQALASPSQGHAPFVVVARPGLPVKPLTLFGWTPGLRQLVSTRILSCGCVAGVYETWSGGRTVIVDERDSGCGDPHHDANAVLDAA